MKLLAKFFRFFLLVSSFFILTQNAFARDHDDEGEYQILQARYGTAQRNVDVTQRLKKLARRDRTIYLSNDSLGIDPHPNRVKALRIYARSDRGEVRMFEYVEGDVIDGTRFRSWDRGEWARDRSYRGAWEVESRWDGRDRDRGDWSQSRSERRTSDSYDEGEYKILQARYGTNEMNVDVTHTLKQLAKADRRFRMGNSSFGIDPHPNRVKTLRIFARGENGKIRVFEYREGSVVDGAMFRGWSSGEWGQGEFYSGGWSGR